MTIATNSISRSKMSWSRVRNWASRVIANPPEGNRNNNVTAGSTSKFRIKPGYTERESPQYFEDVPDGTIYQPDVYELCARLARLGGLRHLVDLGCGFGDKLITACRHHSLMPIGMDHGKNLSHCREAYPEGQWIEVNFENPGLHLLSEDVLKQSAIVSSDLIEHLKDPGPFVSLLRHWLQFARLAVLSTPERDVRWGQDHNGPPPNPHHIREWNAQELHSYLQDGGLTVDFVGLTRTKNTSYSMWTTLVLLGPTRSVSARPSESS